MDRTIINLVSILVGGAGLFTVLTGFNVPELNMSFFGKNPYAIKRDAIDNTMKWMFTLVAGLGLALQVFAEIWGDNLPDRLHNSGYYMAFSVVGLVVVGSLVWLLTGVGNRIARWQWQPAIVESQRELFERAKFIVQHDGWTFEQWEKRATLALALTDGSDYKVKNEQMANQHLNQIEKLLEVESNGDLGERVARLERMFKK